MYMFHYILPNETALIHTKHIIHRAYELLQIKWIIIHDKVFHCPLSITSGNATWQKKVRLQHCWAT